MNRKQNTTKDTEIETRLTVTRGDRGGHCRGKGEGFIGTIIKDTWTMTRWGGRNRGGRWGGLWWWGGVGEEGRKLYLNNNKKKLKKRSYKKKDLYQSR